MAEREATTLRPETGPTITRRERKCLEDHEVYNYTRDKCSGCEPCGDGQGRDFTKKTNLERGDDGSLLCPPCETCPEGSYNNQKMAVECRKCVVECDGLHRNVAMECSRVGDNVCGSCKKGYFDFYGSTDYPCDKIKATTRAHTVDRHAQITMQGHRDYQVGQGHEQLPPTGGMHPNTLVVSLLLAGGLVFIGLLIFISYRVIKSRTNSQSRGRRPRNNRILEHDGLISRYQSSTALGCDQDIECDADIDMGDTTVENNDTRVITLVDDSSEDIENSMGERLGRYDRQHSNEGNQFFHVNQLVAQPRPELPRHSVTPNPGPRPELSGTCLTQPEAFRQVLDQLPEQTQQWKLCQCSSQPCRLCSGLLDTCFTVQIFKGSTELKTVATNVCHCPVDLYRNLGIPDADIYQIDNDRDRDPERIPEKENIIKLLNRWVEIKDKEATLWVLCKALCDSGFHRITELIQSFAS